MPKNILLLLTIFFIASCSPVYKKDYTFSAPPSDLGKMCATGCMDKKNSCEAMCRAEQTNCQRLSDLRAENRYLKYVEEQKRKKEPVEKTISSFKTYSTCGISSCLETCAENHRICYSTCGGQITERTYCAKYCDQ